jgi:hypothetical protein
VARSRKRKVAVVLWDDAHKSFDTCAPGKGGDWPVARRVHVGFLEKHTKRANGQLTLVEGIDADNDDAPFSIPHGCVVKVVQMPVDEFLRLGKVSFDRERKKAAHKRKQKHDAAENKSAHTDENVE